MRVLFLSPRQAWPVNSGAKLRDYHLAKALSMAAELCYLHFEERGSMDWDFPAPNSIRLGVPRPKGYTLWKVFRGLTGKWPLSVLNYLDPAMSASIYDLADRKFDVIQVDALQMSGYLPLLNVVFPGIPVVLDWHNIESELMLRFAENTPSRAKRLYAKLTARRLETLERTILEDPRYAHVVCSEREREQLLTIAPQARIGVVPNGVDTEYFSASPNTGERKNLVFVGSMNYHANAEAAVHFVTEHWPRVFRNHPGWTLQLVGANPSPAVVALAAAPGVEVTGTVPDVRPYYGNALAAVVPLLTGGGTRLKILEAMAAGVPVISTAIGAEGLLVTDQKDILLAEDAAQWDAALASLQDQERWGSLSTAGLELVRSQYDWDIAGRELIRLYNAWLPAA